MTEVRPAKWMDIGRYFQWRNDPEVYQYFKGQDRGLEWESHAAYWRGNMEGTFTIIHEGLPVGYVRIDDEGECTYIIGEKRYWGRGVATEALRLAINRTDRERYLATIHEDNVGSIRVAKKVGFNESHRNGEWVTYVHE